MGKQIKIMVDPVRDLDGNIDVFQALDQAITILAVHSAFLMAKQLNVSPFVPRVVVLPLKS